MITENELEKLALTWFQDSGWEYRHGPDIAPDGDTPERADYRQVLLPRAAARGAAPPESRYPRTNAGRGPVPYRQAGPPLADSQQPQLSRSAARWPAGGGGAGWREARRPCAADRLRTCRSETAIWWSTSTRCRASKQPRRPDLVCFINGIAHGGDRAQEPGRRAGGHLVGFQPVADLQGRDRRSVRVQRGAGDFRWPARARGFADGGPRALSALAHAAQRERPAVAGVRAGEGGARLLRARAAARLPALLHPVRAGRRRHRQEDRRLITSSMRCARRCGPR